MTVKKIIGFLLIAALSLLLSYEANAAFLHLSTYSSRDQTLMVFFLTCALTYILFMLWSEGINFKLPTNIRLLPDLNTLRENAPGLTLAALFFGAYLYFGRVLNDFGIGQVDNLFDADVASWIRRIASPDIKDFEMRGPHPFTYFIFQPFGRSLNLFINDPAISAFVFNAFVGGLCVFLAWLYVKRQFGSKTYAFLMAALLGVSASHFFFGSVVETYIYSAFALLLFCLLIQSQASSMTSLVLSGILTFGITLTNFIQNLIAFVTSRPKLREIIRFAGWVISISLLLTYLHAVIYPASKMFFLTPDVEGEDKFFLEITLLRRWLVVGRLMYLARTLLLYAVVAPKVFVLTTEVGADIPEFRFYKISIGTFHQAGYDGLGQVLIMIWALMFIVSGLVFLWRLIRERKVEMPLAFLVCIAVNAAIHVNYGQELFLYSPDWAYALILFVAFGLAPFARNRIFQAAMFVFVILLAWNQIQFMNIIVQALEQYMRTRG